MKSSKMSFTLEGIGNIDKSMLNLTLTLGFPLPLSTSKSINVFKFISHSCKQVFLSPPKNVLTVAYWVSTV